MASAKRKRVTISIGKKLEIISKLEQGVCPARVAKEYNVGKSNVFDIKKHQNKIKQYAKEATDSRLLKRRFSIRKPNDEKFDKAVHVWYSQNRASGSPISGVIMKKKAKSMYAEMHPEKTCGHFKASSGWLYRFKARHGIRRLGEQRDALSADPSAAITTLKRFVEENGLTPDQVFNCGKTWLYWRLLPKKTEAGLSGKQAKNFQSGRDRVTLMATGNASGDFRLPLVFVHTSAKPRCLAEDTMAALPCHFYSQPVAWMTGNIFSDWFLKHFVPLVKEYLVRKSLPLRAVLLVDNAPSHHVAGNLVSESDDGCIRCMFLPSNVSSLIKPMDPGVLESLKRRYKRDFLRKLWSESESEALASYRDFAKRFTVKDALYMCARAWGKIGAVSLRRSWHKLLPGEGLEEEEEEEEEDDVSVTEEQQQLAISAEEKEEWLGADKNEGAHRTPSDQEIIQQAVIPHAEAEMCLVTSLKWLEQQFEASPTDLLVLRDLHSLAVRKGVSCLGSKELNCAPSGPAGRSLSKSAQQELSAQHRIRQELDGLDLTESHTMSATPGLAHVDDLIKMEPREGMELGPGPRLHPNPIRAGTESGRGVKDEEGALKDVFKCIVSQYDEVKCEPGDISISDHASGK